MWVVDLKEGSPPLDVALAKVEIELERAKFAKEKAIKILHGYGSHGKGGAILLETRHYLSNLKRQRKIKDFYFGDRWNYFDRTTSEILNLDKKLIEDEDLGKNNPGITIVILS